MGRTLHYELRTGETELPDPMEMRIAATQVLWKRRFTWTCEELALGRAWVRPRWPRFPDSAFPADATPAECDEALRRLLYEGFSPAALVAAGYADVEAAGPGSGMSGFTKVRDDEWNAYLVVRFLEWVSRQVPEAEVCVSDEGDYILAAHLVCRSGTWSLDMKRIEEGRRYWRKHGLTASLDRSRGAVADAKRGRFFADVPVAEYLDRPEFTRLPIPKEQMAGMTLAEVARHMTFPGEEAVSEQVAA